jgi:Ubiquitin carboxyl-terminal hydrolase
LLKELFLDLIHSDAAAVTPPKTLAQIALNDTTGVLFGEQQDIMETQDNILDMVDLLVEISGRPGKKIFFGTTRQTVKYLDINGTEKKLFRDEVFHQIIVDVNPCLYSTLDNFFASQTVDYENTVAQRSVSILTFPPILTIRINRVKFDRETNQAFKSNEYLKYPKVLHLSRYCAKHEEIMEKKRESKRKLLNEIQEHDFLLERLTTKQVMLFLM